jgi:hypothetical protein
MIACGTNRAAPDSGSRIWLAEILDEFARTANANGGVALFEE